MSDHSQLAAPIPSTAEASGKPVGIVSEFVTLLGRRTVMSLVITILGSLALAAVELGISVFLQVFLKTIGVAAPEVTTPLGDLNPSATTLALGLAAIALLRGASQFVAAESGYFAMETMNARLRRLAIWEMLLHPSRRVVPASEVNARVGDLASKTSLFCYFGANLVGAAVQALALVPLMFFTAHGETLIAIAGLGVVGLLVLRLNKSTRAVAAHIPAELRVLTEGIARVGRNALLVRVLRTQAIEHRRLVSSVDRYATHLVGAAIRTNFATVVPPFAGILLILVIVSFSQRVLHTPGITLLAFLYLFTRFVAAVGNMANQSSACSTNWPAFKDSLNYVSGFRRGEVDAAMRVGEAFVGRAVERTASSGGEPPRIEVRDVSFKYPGANSDALHNVSVEIAAGTQFAIIGPSGCGKSTLLGLILGVLDPARGEVKVGGRSPSDFFADPTTRVGYVGADPFLVAGSIRDNLRYGLSVEAADSDLLRALDLARMRQAVEALPGGLDYPITEDGAGLSSGQKQRLCLARALLNRPHVLVLDEASANIDNETESEIAESLKDFRGMCTTILVSHRKRILKYADRVVTLGQIE